MANGAGLNISHIGHSQIFGLEKIIALKNILYVPKIQKYLLSANKLMYDNNVFIEIHKHVLFVKDKVTKKTLLFGKSKGGLYPVPIGHS